MNFVSGLTEVKSSTVHLNCMFESVSRTNVGALCWTFAQGLSRK